MTKPVDPEVPTTADDGVEGEDVYVSDAVDMIDEDSDDSISADNTLASDDDSTTEDAVDEVPVAGDPVAEDPVAEDPVAEDAVAEDIDEDAAGDTETDDSAADTEDEAPTTADDDTLPVADVPSVDELDGADPIEDGALPVAEDLADEELINEELADSEGTASADSAADQPAAYDGAGDPTPEKPTILEMRQVAGLTAGSVMGLHKGSFQFRESDKEVGFALTVESPDDVVVSPGSATTMIDEIVVDQPTPLGGGVLNVGTACFTVRRLRSKPDSASRLAAVVAGRTPPKAISVPQFETDQPAVQQQSSSRFGSLFSRNSEEPESELDAQSWQFLESIRDIRSMVAERHRNLHPSPEELKSRLDRLDPGLWDRSIEHPLFGRFAVAYSTIPWEPRFDAPERIPTQLHRPIQEMSCLPWVPITANLLVGPLGIVGGRSAVLACARNAVLSLACLSAPSDIEFSIVTAETLVSDWDWTSALPNSLFPSGGDNYCVAVADGMTHFDGAGLDAEAVKNNEMGLIVLADTVEDLPDYCGTVLQLTPEGQCQVTNHLGEQIVGTPIGVAASFASMTGAALREAIGDGPDYEADDEYDYDGRYDSEDQAETLA